MKTARKPLPKAIQEKEWVEDEISVQEKFKLARQAMSAALVERDDEINLILTALIANENPLLVGPPGTAKTRLFECIADWMDVPKFYYLLTKFTDPGEIFGPIDIVALTKERRTSRVVDGYVPTSVLVAFDEVFKASSAILNCTLTLLNERKVKFGLQEINCPLVCCMGMSNEYPNNENGGRELEALFDRFVLRGEVSYISEAGTKKLLAKGVANDPCRPTFPCKITPEEISKAHNDASCLPWSDEAKRALWDILQELKHKGGILVSDRRKLKGLGVARASAYLAGSDKVLPEHLEILSCVLWDDPMEQPAKCRKIVAEIANPVGYECLRIQGTIQSAEEHAEGRLKELADLGQREGICREVIDKLKQAKKDLSILRDDARRNKVMDYVNDAQKTWDYKINGLTRE